MHAIYTVIFGASHAHARRVSAHERVSTHPERRNAAGESGTLLLVPKVGERYAAQYEINMIRCIFCGYCEDACPTNAIVLEHDYELSFYDRRSTIYTKDMLLVAPDKGHGEVPPVLLTLTGQRRANPPAQIDL